MSSNVLGATHGGESLQGCEIDEILLWLDQYEFSRPTKKLHRDFSDCVLLAELLKVHYPKLVEMHNYPGRNSQVQKLNNWITLNRKVLKKLKLNLGNRSLEQLAAAIPGVIERLLINVRDRIRRDEEADLAGRDTREGELSSGDSQYDTCTEEDGHQVLVVPLKTRKGDAVTTIHKKVVPHENFVVIKDQLKEAKESIATLRLKADHLEGIIKIKDLRISELQKQLARRSARRKEEEVRQIPAEGDQSCPRPDSTKIKEFSTKIPIKLWCEEVSEKEEELEIPQIIVQPAP